MKYCVSLKKNQDFKFVYNQGKSLANKYLVIYILENGLNENRLGISVSKKVGNSVVRHHVTRLVREAYRVNEDIINIKKEANRTISQFFCLILHLGI